MRHAPGRVVGRGLDGARFIEMGAQERRQRIAVGFVFPGEGLRGFEILDRRVLVEGLAELVGQREGADAGSRRLRHHPRPVEGL